jgi:hypothetical protein
VLRSSAWSGQHLRVSRLGCALVAMLSLRQLRTSAGTCDRVLHACGCPAGPSKLVSCK